MSKTTTTIAIGFAALMTASAFTLATAPASQTTPAAPEPAATAWRQLDAPKACDGETWPFRSTHCVSAIMAENGMVGRHVRVISLYQPTADPRSRAYAELAAEFRPTR